MSRISLPSPVWDSLLFQTFSPRGIAQCPLGIKDRPLPTNHCPCPDQFELQSSWACAAMCSTCLLVVGIAPQSKPHCHTATHCHTLSMQSTGERQCLLLTPCPAPFVQSNMHHGPRIELLQAGFPTKLPINPQTRETSTFGNTW